MKRTTLGRGPVPVTALAFGAAAIGNLFTAVTDEAARAAVDAAWDCGIRYFDTAPHYGLGLSERRLGAALRERPRSEFTVSSKVGRLLLPADDPSGTDLDNGFAVPASHRRVWDFSAAGVRRSIEEASIGWVWTGSTSPTCTTPTRTPSRPSPRPIRSWSGCARRG